MAAARSDTDPDDTRLDDKVVKWMPIVVPLFALLLALLVFFIDAAVF